MLRSYSYGFGIRNARLDARNARKLRERTPFWRVRDDVGVTEQESGGEVMRNLPRSRAHRRSAKRASGNGDSAAAAKPRAKASQAKPRPKAAAKPRAKAPAAPKPGSGRLSAVDPKRRRQPAPGGARATQGLPRDGASAPPRRGQTIRPGARSPGAPQPPTGAELVGTVVQAAAEVAQVGLSLGIKALRDATRRVPRP